MGIEPTLAAWEAAVLPLNYTREPAAILRGFTVDRQSPEVGLRSLTGQIRATSPGGVLQVLRRQIDSNRAAGPTARGAECRAGPAERIEHNPACRTGREQGNSAQIDGIGRKMRLPAVCILGNDIPHVARLAALGVIFQEIETPVAQ